MAVATFHLLTLDMVITTAIESGHSATIPIFDRDREAGQDLYTYWRVTSFKFRTILFDYRGPQGFYALHDFDRIWSQM